MNDDAGDCPLKRAVSAAIESLDLGRVARVSREWARHLDAEIAPNVEPGRRQAFAFRLPVYVMASLVGIPAENLPQTALWIDDFVQCLSPNSMRDQVERGKVAGDRLFDMVRSLLTRQSTVPGDGLLAVLAHEAERIGRRNADEIVANGIGFLTQSYEASAGLIGNTLIALATQRGLYEQIASDRSLLASAIQEVLRYDPPIQNTRRYVARSGTVAGLAMKEGDAILVVLAAANRDPAANRDAERFDIFREDPQIFTFGAGPHACPGRKLAAIIAKAGIEQLLESGLDPPRLTQTRTYQPSANARIPVWVSRETENRGNDASL
jgi:cytochrome P450